MDISNNIINNIEKMRKYTLNKDERLYIINRIKPVDLSNYNDRAEAITILSKLLDKEIRTLPSVEKSIDIKEMQVKQIRLNEKGEEMKKLTNKTTVHELLQHPRILQRIFNPVVLVRKAYVMLDRKYQIKSANNKTEFSWFIADSSRVYDTEATAVVHEQISNIISIKLYPFRFPHSYNTISGINRISVEIKELNVQSYVLAYANKRFHFIFDINTTGTGYDAIDVGQSSAVFDFAKPVMELNTITVRFGNPDKTIELDPDYATGTMGVVSAQAVVVFPTPHYCAVGDLVYVTGFTTDSPVEDAAEIELINSIHGRTISAISTYSISINTDLSGLAGNIVGNVLVHFDSKRFGLRMEISYVGSD
jgi:hypothetical protein